MESNTSATPVAVTAQFDMDGSVQPVSFIWIDGREIAVRVIDFMRGAALKHRGWGHRYTIQTQDRGEIVSAYLYRFGDQWLWAQTADDGSLPEVQTCHPLKNEHTGRIIDSRYDNPFKVQVTVDAQFEPDGAVIPCRFRWDDGAVYMVDRVLAVERGVSMKAGITGWRYRIRAAGKAVCLYRDDDLWFMERKGRTKVYDVHGRLLY